MKFSRLKTSSAMVKTLLTYLGISLALLLLPARWTGGARATLLTPVSVAEAGMGAGLRPIGGFFRRFTSMWSAAKEVERLHAVERKLCADLQREAQARYSAEWRLAELGRLPVELHPRVVEASVTGYDVAPFRRSILVDCGNDTGIPVGAPVLSNGVLAGRVESVGATTSRVLLLTDPQLGAPKSNDPKCRVPVRNARSRVQGVLEWAGGDLCSVKYIPAGADVKPGDTFVTSNIDSMIPPGLIIGNCLESSGEAGSHFLWVTVKPLYQADRLEQVSIIIPDTTAPAP